MPGPAVTASTAVPVTSFDGLKWLTDVYAAVADDPFALLDISEQSVVINTPADLFVAHLLGVAITEQVDAGIDPPAPTPASWSWSATDWARPRPSSSAPTSHTTIRTPRWASRRECARPMPRPPPVTTATRPCEGIVISGLSCFGGPSYYTS